MSILSTIEADAEKVLGFLTKADTGITKVAPTVVAGLGTILGAVATTIASGEAAAASSGVNITLDVATFTNVKAVWSDIEAFAKELGIKL